MASHGAGLFLAIALGATAAGPLAGQEPDLPGAGPALDLVTDRPDVTESTNIIAPGWAQLEVGASLAGEGPSTDALSLPGTLLRMGLSRRVEARLGWDGYQDVSADGSPGVDGGSCGGPAGPDTEVCSASGAADGEAGLKILLLERGGWRPDLALLTFVSLPIGDDAFTSGELDPGFKALFAGDFSERVGWGANVGLAWPMEAVGGTESRRRIFSWSYSVGVGLAESLGGFIEVFGEDPSGAAAQSSLDGGLTYKLTPDVQLDASGGFGLDEDAADWFVGGGLAFRLKL